ncbi:MAG: hypothetical protein RSD96_02435 [Bacilli bacterium]
MQNDYGMYQGYNVEANVSPEMTSCCGAPKEATMCGVNCSPVYECPCERVVHRQFCHEVPHI